MHKIIGGRKEKKMFRMGMTFLCKSKMLTFSAFLSIFVACFLSISMFQLSSNVETSIVAGLEDNWNMLIEKICV